MEKLVYVLWKDGSTDSAAFSAALREQLPAQLRGAGASSIAVNLADADVDYASAQRLTRFDPAPAAVVSFWLEDSDLREPLEQALHACCEKLAGYLVVESLPLVNTTHTAAVGQRTPGTNVIALIECPSAMPYADWVEHWHTIHRRVALEVQCTYEYIRNEVVRALTDDAPPFNAIVEEGFPTEAVVDPMLWYCADGSDDKLQENFGRMMESVAAFLEVARVESHPMSQYVLDAPLPRNQDRD